MARTTDTVTIELITNDAQTRGRLESLRKILADTKKKKEEAFALGDMKGYQKYSSEVKKAERELASIETRQQTITRALKDMDKATPKELRSTIKQINKQLNSGDIERGSDEWKKLNAELSQCNTELRRIKAEGAAAQETISEDNALSRFGNKWVGVSTIVTNATSAISAAYGSMSRYVEEYADLAEHMASVTKYTGLSKEDVDDLNESFKKMDTRTSQAALNDLAADAGRLGIQGKQDILDFVDAANQINVALGEDLGENAVREIGKLAQMFGDADTMGLKQAMLSTGSVINELAQSSSANEGYIMDFTSRLAGMGRQAGMTQTQIMGLASVMDQNMVNAEEGSTALSRLIQVIYRKPQEMARAAGLDVREFTELVKTDANEALLQFATAVSNLGGMDKIAPMLGDLQLTGAGVSKAIATLAQNTDLVRQTQEQANKAFQEGTSCTNEYDVANNTVQASLEKAKQKFATLRAELGEELLPVYTTLTTAASGFFSALTATGSFLTRHIAFITSLAVAVATYYTAISLATVKDKLFTAAAVAKNAALAVGKAAQIAYAAATALLTGNVTRATAAMRLLNTTLKASPWGLAAAAIAAVVTAIAMYTSKAHEAAEAQRELNKLRDDAAVKVEEERIKIERLEKVASDETLTMEDRLEAVKKLNEIIPGYNAQIDETTGKYKASNKALTDYLASLKKKYEMEGAKDILAQIGREKANLAIEKQKWEGGLADARKNAGGSSTYAPSLGMAGGAAAINSTRNNIRDATVNTIQNEVDRVNEKISALEKRESAITKIYGNDLGGEEDGGGNGGKPSQSNFSNQSNQSNFPKNSKGSTAPADAIKRRAETSLLAQQIALQKGLVTQQEYEKNVHDIQEKSILEQQALTKQGSAEWLKLEKERLDNDKEYRTQHRAWSSQQIAADEKDEQQQAEQAYLTGQMSYEQYQQKLSEIKMKYLAQRLDLAKQENDATGTADTQKAIEEAQAAYDEEQYKQQKERQKEFLKEINDLKSRYLKQSDEERMNTEIAMLDSLHAQGLVSEEEYQKMILAIKEEYGEKGAEAQKKWYEELKDINFSDSITDSVAQAIAAIASLSEKIGDGIADWDDYEGAAVAALSVVSSTLSTASRLVQANMSAEVAVVEARYDKEIEAAGSSTKKGKRLQEKKEKEIAAIKTKYNKREMAIEIAQATSEAIISSISAYASVIKALPFPANMAVAPIMAAVALASGMANVALIKKQHDAEAAGYSSGGFTGGSDPRKPAGIVHQKEFVVNAKGVANPALAPFLNLIDQAQRNNTVATLNPLATAPAGSLISAQMQPIIAATTATTAQQEEQLTPTLTRLADQLESGIVAYAEISGAHGVARQLDKYKRLTSK